MKVLIVYPELQSFSHKALGVSILSGVLKKEGHEFRLFDSSLYDQKKVLPAGAVGKENLSLPYWFKKSRKPIPMPATRHMDVVDAFNRRLDEFEPDVILVSSTYLSHQIGINLIRKSAAKDALVIYGGVHCTLAPEDAISYGNITYMHRGEGEVSLPLILNQIKGNVPLTECQNLWIKKDNGDVVKNEMVEMIQNLDELPFMDWDNYEDHHYLRLYEGNVYRMGDFSTSRGCVNRCSYCFNQLLYDAYETKKRPIRRYSVERAIEELVYLKDRYKIDFIKFHDSDFLNKSTAYFDRFSSLYKRHVDLPNTVNGCVEHITDQKVKFLVKMNCRSIAIGLESGNETLRKQVLNRGQYTNRTFIENLKKLDIHGIRSSVPCMLGLPGESRKDMRETIAVAKKAKVGHADFCIFFPFPKLPLTEYAISKGQLHKDQKLDHVRFGVESALTLEDMTHTELRNILRCTMLYLKLPYLLWPLIRWVEKHNTDDSFMWHLSRKIYFMKTQYLSISPFLRERRRSAVLKSLCSDFPMEAVPLDGEAMQLKRPVDDVTVGAN